MNHMASMRYAFLAVLLWLLAPPVVAQSLLLNGSFEDFQGCPNRVGDIDRATGWFHIIETPDLFSQCESQHFLGVPANFMGRLEAQDGHSYAGISLFMKQLPRGSSPQTDYDRYEDISTYLAAPTVPGTVYEFTVWYALADSSEYFAPALSLTLESTKYSRYLNPRPSQLITVSLARTPGTQWVNGVARFAAQGKWDEATIGLSRQLLSLKDYKRCLRRNKTGVRTSRTNQSSYYYLDNLSLTPVATNTTLVAPPTR
jgi:hypothetical protein